MKLKWGKENKKERKFEGCETCNVGVFYGLQVSGYFEVYCRSARLGLDDKLSYVFRSGRFKLGEKYPIWCPEEDNILKNKGVNKYV